MSTGQEESEESQFVDLHYPGPIHIADSLKGTDTFRTVIELNTDQQVIYRFNGLDSPDVPETRSSGFYERAEPYIDRMAHLLFIAEWNEMTRACDDTIDSINNEDDPRYKLAKKIKGKCKDALDRGPSKHEIEEVKGIIRRTSQIDREKMNPDTHIPFKNDNCPLNLKFRLISECKMCRSMFTTFSPYLSKIRFSKSGTGVRSTLFLVGTIRSLARNAALST